MTDKDLLAMTQRTFKGDSTGLVRQLANQLLLERSCNKAVIENMVRQRMRVVEMERRMKPVGRVLLIDAPAVDPMMSNGDLIVYTDPAIDFCMVKLSTPWESPDFETELETELGSERERFRQMPWELGPRYEAAWSRKPRRRAKQQAAGGSP